MQKTIAVQCRWLIRRDMPEVLAIEAESFPTPWTEEDFLCCLRQRNVIGMVAEYQEEIVGFMVYELEKSALHVLNFAVEPSARRLGIGRQMVEKLKFKLSQQRRTRIVLEVAESSLGAQLFFRSMGFTATGIITKPFDDIDDDAYRMTFTLGSPEAVRPLLRNRLTEFFTEP